MAKGKYLKKKQSPLSGMTVILLLLLLGLGALLMWKACSAEQTPATTDSTPKETVSGTSGENPQVTTQEATEPPVETTTAPTEPYITSTASIGVTGDMLIHSPMLTGAKQSDGSYDFSGYYKYVQDYYKRFDFMIANLEVTLGGEEAGDYTGYPTFNCPDSIVDALKNAGVDMVLTANNHSYDTGHEGFLRTQLTLMEKEMLYLGSRPSEEANNYVIQDINGVKVGMVCYTYESKRNSEGIKYLNGIKVSKEDTNLLNSFSYDRLTTFYAEVDAILEEMDSAGADVTMFFMHWGNEYQRKPSSQQTKISQELCERGVDVIIGGHPHVIQPFTTLTSTTGHETYCLYSTGNAVSNQRRESLKTVEKPEYTEDGLVFSVKFEKWSDGTVNISEVDALPTWVDRIISNNQRIYTIVPLDPEADWSAYELGTHKRLNKSYAQTMSVIGEGLNAVREKLGLEAKPLTVE